jgi:hypothetical protein
MKTFLSILFIFSITFTAFSLDKQYEKDNHVEPTSISCDFVDAPAACFDFNVKQFYAEQNFILKPLEAVSVQSFLYIKSKPLNKIFLSSTFLNQSSIYLKPIPILAVTDYRNKKNKVLKL